MLRGRVMCFPTSSFYFLQRSEHSKLYYHHSDIEAITSSIKDSLELAHR